MALDIVTQESIIDETAGLSDDDVNSAIAPHNNSTVSYLLGRDAAGGLSSPQVAFQANFIVASGNAGETITSVALARNDSGAPFSTTDGVNSGLRTVEGNYVWLFRDATYPNIVIGVIGTSDPTAEPSESGALAYALALMTTSATNADLYTVQYVALLNPDATNADDRIDLTNKVYASVSGTTTANFSQLGDAPPGHNNWYILDADAGGPQKILVTAHEGTAQSEVNVSTQGLGVASQDVRFGRELQIDLISGGTQSAGKNFTDSPTGPDYGAHIENVSSAGFSVSQSTPTNTRADIEIRAYNNDDDVEGSLFPGDDNDTEVNITGVTFKVNGVPKTAAELGITFSLSGLGLVLNDVPEGVTCDFTTAGGVGGTFDRFTIKNIDTEKDYFDVKEVHYAGQTANSHNEEVGSAINFDDDGPIVSAAFDADPSTTGIQTPEHLGNAAGQSAGGIFGYDLGADQHTAAYYTGGGSDFIDANPNLAGVQISLTGTVDNSQNPNITGAVATLTAESATSATFSFLFHYDKDPITAGVQDATAAGTLVFNKTADTYTLNLTDPIDGFSFDVLHTNELVAKQPTGNTGHPLIVAEQLTANNDPDPFYVQFTGNSITQQVAFGFNGTGDGDPTAGDTDFTGSVHDMISSAKEDWVSATRATNGVAGDTIQKGELLTLRFFKENILGDVVPGSPGGGTEKVTPTATTSGVVVKFDGIGASEDLIVILDLIDASNNHITRAVNVQNADLIKGNANIPSPYSAEFTLDNNDALLIIEQNDYCAAGETFKIQGIQIMQSANGLTGLAINLNGATGTNGGSNATSGLTQWDPTDNDVLKIVDIGFVQQTSGTIDAHLDFGFNVADADGDPLGIQHIPVHVSDFFIV
jgi:hypothetical protein